MTTYVFPGQGAQKLGMGKDLFERYPELISQADELLGYSLTELCLEDPNRQMNLTQFTQPALYVVNALTYFQKRDDGEPIPTYCAGHSLGEYNALLAAGVFDFITGLKLVQKRGELMANAGLGGMAAVMNISLKEIEGVLASQGLGALDVANFNAPSQIVISGPKEDIERAAPAFEKAGARYVVIKVNSAFHSRYMTSSRDEFAQFLETFSFQPLERSVISNVTARPYLDHQVKALLADQINHSVNWVDSMRYLLAKGQEEFVECGPGRVLTGLMRKIKSEAEPMILDEAGEVRTSGATLALPTIRSEQLGSRAFREAHKLRYAYMASALDRGVSSVASVVALGRAGLLGCYGAVGLPLERVRADLSEIRERLEEGSAFAMSLSGLASMNAFEDQLVDLYLAESVQLVEAANYLQITASLVRYRIKGIRREGDRIVTPNQIIARITRPEAAQQFMSPAPERFLSQLQREGHLTEEEVALAREVPMAHDICAVADSGGPTDQAMVYALTPSILRLRDEACTQFGYRERIRVGCSGGIGTPEAAAAAFVLGADFIATGTINQATLEAATSDTVKQLLVTVNIQDTTYAPAGEMFETGARMQVLKRSLFFPARANKLYALYQQYEALEEIDADTRQELEEKYFRRSFSEVWRQLTKRLKPEELAKAERNPKYKMLMTFKWYFDYSWQIAVEGAPDGKVDYQVFCGPAMGAFNQWMKGTAWENEWRPRQIHLIGEKLMEGTAEVLTERFHKMAQPD